MAHSAVPLRRAANAARERGQYSGKQVGILLPDARATQLNTQLRGKKYMAKSASTNVTPVTAAAMPDVPAEYQGMSLEELQRVIALTTLQSNLLELDRIKDDNARRLAHNEAIRKHNVQLQADMESERRQLAYVQSVCRHRQGGRAQNVYAGDGKPCIVRTQMLDGYTWLLQCLLCRLKVYTPHPALKREAPEEYATLKTVYDKLWELSSDSGLDEIRGPTFLFEKDGVPFIPQRT